MTISDVGLVLVYTKMSANDKETREVEAERSIIIYKEDLSSVSALNSEQKATYDQILACTDNNESKCFFTNGPGSIEKPFYRKYFLQQFDLGTK